SWGGPCANGWDGPYNSRLSTNAFQEKSMASLGSFCRIATPFTKTGELDEDALREFLQRFIKSKIGVYLGSAGAGETHALTWDEIQRIYEIGYEECKGKIPVYANPPEQYSVRSMRELV